MLLHYFAGLLDDQYTACGIPLRLVDRERETTGDPLLVDCPLCHDNQEFDEILARAEYAPIPVGRLSHRQGLAQWAPLPPLRWHEGHPDECGADCLQCSREDHFSMEDE